MYPPWFVSIENRNVSRTRWEPARYNMPPDTIRAGRPHKSKTALPITDRARQVPPLSAAVNVKFRAISAIDTLMSSGMHDTGGVKSGASLRCLAWPIEYLHYIEIRAQYRTAAT